MHITRKEGNQDQVGSQRKKYPAASAQSREDSKVITGGKKGKTETGEEKEVKIGGKGQQSLKWQRQQDINKAGQLKASSFLTNLLPPRTATNSFHTCMPRCRILPAHFH